MYGVASLQWHEQECYDSKVIILDNDITHLPIAVDVNLCQIIYNNEPCDLTIVSKTSSVITTLSNHIIITTITAIGSNEVIWQKTKSLVCIRQVPW